MTIQTVPIFGASRIFFSNDETPYKRCHIFPSSAAAVFLFEVLIASVSAAAGAFEGMQHKSLIQFPVLRKRCDSLEVLSKQQYFHSTAENVDNCFFLFLSFFCFFFFFESFVFVFCFFCFVSLFFLYFFIWTSETSVPDNVHCARQFSFQPHTSFAFYNSTVLFQPAYCLCLPRPTEETNYCLLWVVVTCLSIGF